MTHTSAVIVTTGFSNLEWRVLLICLFYEFLFDIIVISWSRLTAEIMSAVDCNIESRSIPTLHNEVLEKLTYDSAIKTPQNALPFFDPIIKNEIPCGYTRNNKLSSNVFLSLPRELTEQEIFPLLQKGDLTLEGKLNPCSILIERLCCLTYFCCP